MTSSSTMLGSRSGSPSMIAGLVLAIAITACIDGPQTRSVTSEVRMCGDLEPCDPCPGCGDDGGDERVDGNSCESNAPTQWQAANSLAEAYCAMHADVIDCVASVVYGWCGAAPGPACDQLLCGDYFDLYQSCLASAALGTMPGACWTLFQL